MIAFQVLPAQWSVFVMLFDSGGLVMTCFSCLLAVLLIVQALARLAKNAALAEGVAEEDILDF